MFHGAVDILFKVGWIMAWGALPEGGGKNSMNVKVCSKQFLSKSILLAWVILPINRGAWRVADGIWYLDIDNIQRKSKINFPLDLSHQRLRYLLQSVFWSNSPRPHSYWPQSWSQSFGWKEEATSSKSLLIVFTFPTIPGLLYCSPPQQQWQPKGTHWLGRQSRRQEITMYR